MKTSEALKDIQNMLEKPVNPLQLVNILNESASVLLPQIDHCLPRAEVNLSFVDKKASLPADFYKGRALLIDGQSVPYSPVHLFRQTDKCRWTVRDGQIIVSCDTTNGLLIYLRKPSSFSLDIDEENWWTQDILRWQTLKYLTLTRYLLDKDRWSLWTALFKNALEQLQKECSSKKGHIIEGEVL